MTMSEVVSFMTTIIVVIPAQNAIRTLGPMTMIATIEIAMQRTFHTRQFLLVRDPEEEGGVSRVISSPEVPKTPKAVKPEGPHECS